jgi:hypothetical protein
MINYFYLFFLQGYALVDRGSGPDTICLLRVEDLSEDTVERFNQLFALREKWTEADITPYIKLVWFHTGSNKTLWDSCYSDTLMSAFHAKHQSTSLISGRIKG